MNIVSLSTEFAKGIDAAFEQARANQMVETRDDDTEAQARCIKVGGVCLHWIIAPLPIP
jgi:hypothetical protein